MRRNKVKYKSQTSNRASRARSIRILITVFVALIVELVDQSTKSWAISALTQRSEHVIGPIYFRLALNTGAAFSLGANSTKFVVTLALIVVVVVVALAFTSKSLFQTFAFGLILGGAFGNLSDRAFRHENGAVIDFIYTSFWPTFNVADSSITVGVLLLLFSYIMPKLKNKGVSKNHQGASSKVDNQNE